ncbi:phospholipase D-like domain-containing protein [Pseudobacteriovorax antillogorgiicola]|uniref:phospholipase D n=1 Tax=Pseudobacteriovorax antillogorgiicola TaxID=1513793 RepID=A0A1Y6BST2_9BACT|nr:phospholipase D-like domain-containing protein [Pseudobacteriovorax antillogorgiicola]TCS53037.1 phosphatidylserine/phosphatidylglycerophosphate/cardiolipin synthase-like enzyme [Pseudobacteriovorax antillogorgiicola]SMF26552.1 Phosphatidylserine/phosphatidylglycerophosphate/cardiolipin synthase [Pseudobacteriovorax antillogorgiicola]
MKSWQTFLSALALLGAIAAQPLSAAKVEGVDFSECAEDLIIREARELEVFSSQRWPSVRTQALASVNSYLATGNVITSLDSLGQLAQVGPASLRQFSADANVLCDLSTTDPEPPVDGGDPDANSEAFVIFSPQPIEDSHLAVARQWIDDAQSSIDIAMYSMRETSADIFDALERAKERNVRIRFLFEKANADRKKPENSFSAKLESIGIDVRYINKIMHHKFAVIDGRGADSVIKPKLITGSANWTSSAATKFDENTVFVRGNVPLIDSYRREFDFLWQNSRDFVWESFDFDISFEPLLESPLDDEELDELGFNSHFTSANFKVFENRYGKGFTTIRQRDTVSNEIVEVIESATSSIKVATGHLRSFPISTALMNAKAKNPNLNIQILLDNQEYISASYDRTQKAKQQKCVEDATSEAKRQDCYDSGYYYSYDVSQSGIDLRFKTYAYRWHYSYAPQMHHKYLIVDNQTVVTGSFNFSDNAEHNTMENIIIFERKRYPEMVDDFTENFAFMWDRNRAKLSEVRAQIETQESFPIVFEDMALEYEEVNALKRLIYNNCPLINSEDFRKYPERNRYCSR